MHSRLVVSLLCASALAFACGPLTRATEVRGEPAEQRAAADTTTHDVAASLDVVVGPTVELSLAVANVGDRRVELDFPSGQTHELVILDAAGREVWRWSAGRLFTQTVQTKLLATGESSTYAEEWEPGALRGTFTVVASLKSDNHPIELRRGFTIE
ncbi:MAG TPA: BsuPI-related putative proteinase inhibitor [Gemmatimonadaceae bacterium]|nr:BsuPI-related putative proteinase inhibitor [Gemmatimonadaceae bacterium]